MKALRLVRQAVAALRQAQGPIVEAWLLSPSKHTNQNSGTVG